MAGLVAVAIVSPWFVRNLVVFNGQALYSTQTGMNILEGMVTPDGRIHGNDWEKLSSRCGYTLRDIEVNSDSRLTFPSEPELDRKAAHAAVAELSRVNLFRLGTDKLSYFWLSFDQTFGTQDMQISERFVRIAGVLMYWPLPVGRPVGMDEMQATGSRCSAIVRHLCHCRHLFASSLRHEHPNPHPLCRTCASHSRWACVHSSSTKSPQLQIMKPKNPVNPGEYRALMFRAEIGRYPVCLP